MLKMTFYVGVKKLTYLTFDVFGRMRNIRIFNGYKVRNEKKKKLSRG